mgnify:FL=1
MKKLILSLVAIATISLSTFGQAPEGFKYQAVLRDAGNTILNNQAVGMRMTIQQGSIGGATVYQETFAPTTNGYGLVNLEIGSGTVVSGDFTTIDWGNGPYFIETAADVTGGTSYTVMGTSRLMSVPYALYAKTSGNGQGPQGPAGNDGADGADGTNGTNGTDGATGLTGPAGAQGPQGPAGNDGAVGATGAQGPIGLTGAPGIQGLPGNDGAVGPQGTQGLTGNDGIDGVDGAAGTNGTNGTDGATGLTGPAGAQGPQGPAGNDGAVGATGAQGPIGLTGAPGIQGLPGNDGAVGPQGTQGLTGNDGIDGVDGAVGPQGTQGIAGNDGIDGAAGTQGIQGLAGNDGIDGAAGTQGIQGIAGDDGIDGAAGTQGIQGLAGNDGVGIAQTLSQVGSVVTLSDGGGTISVNDTDSDPTNELQVLSLSNDTLYLSNGNNVYLGNSPGIVAGSTPGEMLYWNGSDWVIVNIGVTGQTLYYCYGVPTWGPCLAQVITSLIVNITGNEATSGGNVTNDGGSSVIARGVCWGINPSPDLTDNFTSDGSGTGTFNSNMLGLTSFTTYYVRAYATNSGGTTYGNELTFVSGADIPVVTTLNVNSIYFDSCAIDAEVLSNGGETVTERGVCYSTSPNPTISNNIVLNGSGLGPYSCNLTGLTGATLYYVRAYATNSTGTAYGNELTFTTYNTPNSVSCTGWSGPSPTSPQMVSGGYIEVSVGTSISINQLDNGSPMMNCGCSYFTNPPEATVTSSNCANNSSLSETIVFNQCGVYQVQVQNGDCNAMTYCTLSISIIGCP